MKVWALARPPALSGECALSSCVLWVCLTCQSSSSTKVPILGVYFAFLPQKSALDTGTKWLLLISGSSVKLLALVAVLSSREARRIYSETGNEAKTPKRGLRLVCCAADLSHWRLSRA